jgi:hypothetical protein
MSLGGFAFKVIGPTRDFIGRQMGSSRVANSGYVDGNTSIDGNTSVDANTSLAPFNLNESHRGNDRWTVTRQDVPAHRPQSPGFSRTASHQLNVLSSFLVGDSCDTKLRVPVFPAAGEIQLPS